MRTTIEQLPDRSNWHAILHGPIVLASPTGTENLDGLRADDSRMGHVAHGPLEPIDKAPVLLAPASAVPSHVRPDPDGKPLHFRLTDVAIPAPEGGLPLVPFFRLHDARYQIYWTISDAQKPDARAAAEERAKIARDEATIDSVTVGEQQPEVEHAFQGEDTRTGISDGRHWRSGRSFQYTLDLRGAKAADLAVISGGGDANRTFDISANGTVLATERLTASQPGKLVEKRYPLPEAVIKAASDGKITIKFSAPQGETGSIFDVRLLKPGAPALPSSK
jgi:hypothetical protein